MSVKKVLCIVGLLVLPGLALGQRRINNPTQLWPELQGELALQNNAYLWLSAQNQRAAESRYNNGTFDYVLLRAGYERFWSEQWSWGLTGRYAATSADDSFTPELLLRHRSRLLGLTLGQRLSLEYALQGGAARNLGAARLRLDAERIIPVGNIALRPRVAWEGGLNLRLQPPDDQPDERTLDQSRFRAEVGIRVSDHLDLTPYFARQTDFTITQFQFDADGNITSGGRTNIVTPIVGLDVRFTLFQGKQSFERIQLPTQH
ncbi:DUF2490 domain-containing protein [Hymenobacter oligotrophus]|uniref:DUF2490 domain-containing protein n=1 Tax=Hymenobacter oligotrophus TaxID=2319843 RepID=A0A3B7R573_9BACT|nr:DUF2490 domain-containing protein [Hymenobacter oligotrophus]AYA38490.1 DUF2490 domain-containing protein [Hymenobacter oligotrophus]